MRTLTRTLALLAGALVLGGVVAEAASASRDDQVHAFPSIKGAGSISGPTIAGRWSGTISCEQATPVVEASVLSCPTPWRYWSGTVGDVQLPLTAVAATGWKFLRWTGCTSVSGSTCALDSLAGRGIMQYSPQAVFSDEPPEGVANLEAVAGSAEGTYRVTWTAQETGLIFRCSVDGAASQVCRPGLVMVVPEGEHTVEVFAKDSNGNAGPVKTVRFTRVDTTVTAAPPFAAKSGAGREFDCSVDGAPFAVCGSAHPGEEASLNLPVLADGRHTVRVRARTSRWVDLFPETRTFTIATAAPRTTTTAPQPTAPEADVQPTAPILTAAPVAPQRLSFKLRYATRKGRLTRLAVTDLAPRADLRISVKCPKRKGCPRGFTKWNALGTVELKRLVGKRLPPGTKVTVRARRGAETVTRSINPRKG